MLGGSKMLWLMLHGRLVDEKGCSHASGLGGGGGAHLVGLVVALARAGDSGVTAGAEAWNRADCISIQTSNHCKVWLLGILVWLLIVDLLDANSLIDMLPSRRWHVLRC